MTDQRELEEATRNLRMWPAFEKYADLIERQQYMLKYKGEVIDQRNLMLDRREQEIERLNEALRAIMRLAPTSPLVQSLAKRALKDRSPAPRRAGNPTV